MNRHFFLSLIFLSLIFLNLFGCEQKTSAPAYQWAIPEGFPKPQVPSDNPMSDEKVALGRFLFYDTNLSANQTQSCASCHQQPHAFAEPLKVSVGSTGERHRRNAQALVNIAYNKTLTWAHPSLDSIELQMLLPLFGETPVEMGITGHEQTVLARFNNGHYQTLFVAAFGSTEVSFNKINQAIASFVRSLVSFTSPFDQYAYGLDDNALNESQLRGMNLFFSERLECHHCHGGFNFTQSTSHEKQLLDRRPFHNTGLYNQGNSYPNKDIGLAEMTLELRDNGAFRAPTLRNIAKSSPYMHDGSVATLADVVDIYAAGGRNVTQGDYIGDGRQNSHKSPFVKGFELSESEKTDLLAFLNSLTDQAFLTNAAFSNPFVSSQNHQALK
ncbi:di-heme enzyme [Pseudoalteromonas tunicata]|uniref:methanobactin export MATE transporter MbnM n=1 Tax=Pseudoalteromonas tunicata TaxID=314281 RepID=UPI00273DCCEF|nr:methanobactin export MATE transporter MbnM [Pseudoalteromonas tunicata]MDP5214558.1 di-heme enzyme [Pseudoalteromonas tunicata]